MSFARNRAAVLNQAAGKFHQRTPAIIRKIDLDFRRRGFDGGSYHPRIDEIINSYSIIVETIVDHDKACAERMLARVRESGKRPRDANPFSKENCNSLIACVRSALNGIPESISGLSQYLHNVQLNQLLRLADAGATNDVTMQYENLRVEFDEDVSAAFNGFAAKFGSKQVPSQEASSVDNRRKSDPPSPAPGKRPRENAFMAWRLRDLTGILNQTELAQKLTEQGVNATQGQVSRWLKEVEKYLAAGNILPLLDPLPDKPQTVDPAMIDMGQREDARTPRQRNIRNRD